MQGSPVPDTGPVPVGRSPRRHPDSSAHTGAPQRDCQSPVSSTPDLTSRVVTVGGSRLPHLEGVGSATRQSVRHVRERTIRSSRPRGTPGLEDRRSLVSLTPLWAYAFPPIPLLSQVLEKISGEHYAVIPVAPAWPTQSWFPLLLRLTVDHPRRLPPTARLLRQPGRRNVFHDNPGHLQLHAW